MDFYKNILKEWFVTIPDVLREQSQESFGDDDLDTVLYGIKLAYKRTGISLPNSTKFGEYINGASNCSLSFNNATELGNIFVDMKLAPFDECISKEPYKYSGLLADWMIGHEAFSDETIDLIKHLSVFDECDYYGFGTKATIEVRENSFADGKEPTLYFHHMHTPMPLRMTIDYGQYIEKLCELGAIYGWQFFFIDDASLHEYLTNSQASRPGTARTLSIVVHGNKLLWPEKDMSFYENWLKERNLFISVEALTAEANR